jgi:hypothetical protein
METVVEARMEVRKAKSHIALATMRAKRRQWNLSVGC